MRHQYELGNVESLAFVVMPDHFHWLFTLQNDNTLAKVMQQVKGSSSALIQKSRREREDILLHKALWQNGYHDHALRTEEDLQSYLYQRDRIKQYLEEVYVRQGEFEYCETDDNIAYYTQNSPNEKKIIYSSDGDLTQLVSENTQVYNPSHRKLYSQNDIIIYEHEEILIENVRLVKMICGDSSDNIAGIRGMGIKRFLSLVPELRNQTITVNQVKDRCNQLFEQDKHNKLIANLLTGVTKHGVLGEEFFDVNQRIVSLDEPFLTDEAKETIDLLINESLDQEGRSYKNVMRMMQEDGLFNILPKAEDSWINFINPFLRLTRKEKNINNNKTKTIKVRPYE